MKKIIVSLFLVIVFVLSGCDIADLLVDQVAVHNGLVDRMDVLLGAEESFYNEYFLIDEESDLTFIVSAFEDFKVASEELDDYFFDTTFASEQQVFVDEYHDYYRVFVLEYLDYLDIDFSINLNME